MKFRTLLAVLLMAGALLPGTASVARADLPGLYVRMGEAYIFRVEGGQPVDARPSGPDEHPAAGEVRVELSGSSGSLLMLQNGGPVSLNYRAAIARSPTDRGQSTSVCTLMPGLLSVESWGEAMVGIRLSDFEPGGAGMVCR